MAATNYDLAASHLGSKMPKAQAVKIPKEFHVKELHDGTYHTVMHHSDMKPSTEGSAVDLDSVIDQLHDHMLGKKESPAEEKKESAAEKKAESD